MTLHQNDNEHSQLFRVSYLFTVKVFRLINLIKKYSVFHAITSHYACVLSGNSHV